MTTAELLDDTGLQAGAGKTGVLLVPKHDEGHAQYEWDKDDPADVAEARKVFDAKKALGYSAFRVDPKSGDKGAQLKAFDPAAEKVVMVPPFAGG